VLFITEPVENMLEKNLLDFVTVEFREIVRHRNRYQSRANCQP
jgi:hypothetical protein